MIYLDSFAGGPCDGERKKSASYHAPKVRAISLGDNNHQVTAIYDLAGQAALPEMSLREYRYRCTVPFADGQKIVSDEG
jgi:hypothetical protein